MMMTIKMAACCSCNGENAQCVCCIRVKSCRHCFNCRPKQNNKCQNTICQRQSQINDSFTLATTLSSTCTPSSSTLDSCQTLLDSNIDCYLQSAFGHFLDHTEVQKDTSQEWVSRWSMIVHLKGKLFYVPGGSIGCHYVEQLSKEVLYLANGTFPSE